MINYVLGFAFSRDAKEVVLIEKSHPDWQKGKFNGVGGKIDSEDKSPMDAMYREFKEETGVEINREGGRNSWQHFSTMKGHDWICYCFKTFTNAIYGCKTIEEEKVEIMALDTALNIKPIIGNIKWLLNLATDTEPVYAEIEY